MSLTYLFQKIYETPSVRAVLKFFPHPSLIQVNDAENQISSLESTGGLRWLVMGGKEGGGLSTLIVMGYGRPASSSAHPPYQKCRTCWKSSSNYLINGFSFRDCVMKEISFPASLSAQLDNLHKFTANWPFYPYKMKWIWTIDQI